MFVYCGNNPIAFSDPSGQYYCVLGVDTYGFQAYTLYQCIGGGSCCGGGLSSGLTNTSSNRKYLTNYTSSSDTNQVKQDLVDDGYAFYKGAFVLKIDLLGKNAASFGIIVMGRDVVDSAKFDKTLNHEYGHYLQLQEYGLASFATTIAIPSVAANLIDRADLLPWSYYSSPWEYEADHLAGVSRSNYSAWASEVSFVYSCYSRLIALMFSVS